MWLDKYLIKFTSLTGYACVYMQKTEPNSFRRNGMDSYGSKEDVAMRKPVSIDQSHAVMAALATNVDWDALDSEGLQGIIRASKDAGKQFTAFLKNGGRMVIGELKTLFIDRTTPFDPEKFIGKGWSIAEQDERSLSLAELDLAKAQFETCLKQGENSIKGEEKLKRLKQDGRIRLDVKVFQILWENQHLIPESWKEKIDGNTRYIFFDGTILRDPLGDRFALYLCWLDGEWRWGYSWLGYAWNAINPSAVLASI